MTLAEPRSLLAALPEASLLVSGTGEILTLNPSAARLFGRPEPNLVGVSLLDRLSSDRERARRYLRMAAGSRSPLPGLLVLADGDDGPLACRAEASCVVPWSAERAAVVLLRLVPRDEETDRFLILNQKVRELSDEIRQRIRLERERDRLIVSERQARAAAEEASRLKDEFLSVVSHELRTPLNTILIWASLLRKPNLEDRTRARGLDAVERAARQLGELIQDLLDTSRAIRGRVRLRTMEVDLAALVRAALETVRPTAELKGVRLEADLSDSVGALRGDPERLREVAWHLLSNAVKYTPSGGRASVALRALEGAVELQVADTGVGIPGEALPHIFDRFQQGEPSRTRSERGLGLGLAMVRHLVELHGGTVQAHSEGPGKGSTFTVRLPRVSADAEAAAAPASEGRGGTPPGADVNGIPPARPGERPPAGPTHPATAPPLAEGP